MERDTEPSVFSAAVSQGQGTTTVVPQYQSQQSLVNLGAAAALNFDFSPDAAPIFDYFVFADQALDLAIFIRQSSSDTYRQWGDLVKMTEANKLIVLLNGKRIPGSNVRLQLQNNTVSATTTLSAQAHMRSL